MRITKAGKRYVQDLNSQDFPWNPPPAKEMLKTATEQYIWLLELYAPQCGIDKKRVDDVLRALVRLQGES